VRARDDVRDDPYWKSCLSKSAYSTLELATEVMAGRPVPLRAYRCRRCGKWHLTHKEQVGEMTAETFNGGKVPVKISGIAKDFHVFLCEPGVTDYDEVIASGLLVATKRGKSDFVDPQGNRSQYWREFKALGHVAYRGQTHLFLRDLERAAQRSMEVVVTPDPPHPSTVLRPVESSPDKAVERILDAIEPDGKGTVPVILRACPTLPEHPSFEQAKETSSSLRDGAMDRGIPLLATSQAVDLREVDEAILMLDSSQNVGKTYEFRMGAAWALLRSYAKRVKEAR
jgi:hypothetical protein